MIKKIKIPLIVIICLLIRILIILGILSLLFINFFIFRKEVSSSAFYDERESQMSTEEINEIYYGYYDETEADNRLGSDVLVAQMLESANSEDVYISAHDGAQLYGLVLTQDNSNLWAIVVHGYGSDHKEALDVTLHFYEQGYNVITPDLRGHSQSEGDYISFGHLDGKDIVSWANYINEQTSDAKIILHGSSLGASSVLMACGESSLPSNVLAAISDSAYTSFEDVVTYHLSNIFNVPSSLPVDILLNYTHLFTGVNLNLSTPINTLQNTDLPILFTHGNADDFVPFYMMDILYENYDGEKQQVAIENADHIAGRYLNPDLYYGAIFEFIDNYL